MVNMNKKQCNGGQKAQDPDNNVADSQEIALASDPRDIRQYKELLAIDLLHHIPVVNVNKVLSLWQSVQSLVNIPNQLRWPVALHACRFIARRFIVPAASEQLLDMGPQAQQRGESCFVCICRLNRNRYLMSKFRVLFNQNAAIELFERRKRGSSHPHHQVLVLIAIFQHGYILLPVYGLDRANEI